MAAGASCRTPGPWLAGLLLGQRCSSLSLKPDVPPRSLPPPPHPSSHPNLDPVSSRNPCLTFQCLAGPQFLPHLGGGPCPPQGGVLVGTVGPVEMGELREAAHCHSQRVRQLFSLPPSGNWEKGSQEEN